MAERFWRHGSKLISITHYLTHLLFMPIKYLFKIEKANAVLS